jgi:UDP-N-acetylmuramate dehydrogenase
MNNHVSFRVGGPADAYVIPENAGDVRELLRLRRELGVSLFILGAGANILVSDLGIRGIVVDMKRFNYCYAEGTQMVAGAGTPMSRASECAAAKNLSGLEFIYGMPGSVGGSVWMNARCYQRSISESLTSVTLVDGNGDIFAKPIDTAEFSYKKSPFQRMTGVILEAIFGLHPGNGTEIASSMKTRYNDRRNKGHFAAPSVGSVFKNNHSFGAPTGKILDELGLRGYTVGNARIAEFHANIVINRGNAKAADILTVIEHAEKLASKARGISLEREVILVGEWR